MDPWDLGEWDKSEMWDLGEAAGDKAAGGLGDACLATGGKNR